MTTRRQAVPDAAGNSGPGHNPAGPLTDPARPVEMINIDPDGDGIATTPRVRRRRRRMRGRRHVPPFTSTDVRDLVPAGKWTLDYLATVQPADSDQGPLRDWKQGPVEKPCWSVVRGFSLALKAYWQQYDLIVL